MDGVRVLGGGQWTTLPKQPLIDMSWWRQGCTAVALVVRNPWRSSDILPSTTTPTIQANSYRTIDSSIDPSIDPSIEATIKANVRESMKASMREHIQGRICPSPLKAVPQVLVRAHRQRQGRNVRESKGSKGDKMEIRDSIPCTSRSTLCSTGSPRLRRTSSQCPPTQRISSSCRPIQRTSSQRQMKTTTTKLTVKNLKCPYPSSTPGLARRER
mmetsp:Transcript_27798/g.44213  ORF Transcript_27798/g.44213 Transcript_27798/m.44213 type:complete len:214 (+) Transcript_27798:1307-1948(+)